MFYFENRKPEVFVLKVFDTVYCGKLIGVDGSF